MKIRPERVAQLMRREVADVLANKLRDPRLSHWVSVTDVESSATTCRSPRSFVSILPTGEERARTLEALSGAAGFVRRELAPRLGLREVPELRFMLDSSIERGARVEELLKKIEQGERDRRRGAGVTTAPAKAPPSGSVVTPRDSRDTRLLLVDKPTGVTSHDIVDVVRRRLRERSAGHLGTLDPGASGLLVVALGAATRCSHRVARAARRRTPPRLRFGVVTSTQDLHRRGARRAAGRGAASRTCATRRERSSVRIAATAADDVGGQGRRTASLPPRAARHHDRARAARCTCAAGSGPTSRPAARALPHRAARAGPTCGHSRTTSASAWDAVRSLASLRRLRSEPFDVERAVSLARPRHGVPPADVWASAGARPRRGTRSAAACPRWISDAVCSVARGGRPAVAIRSGACTAPRGPALGGARRRRRRDRARRAQARSARSARAIACPARWCFRGRAARRPNEQQRDRGRRLRRTPPGPPARSSSARARAARRAASARCGELRSAPRRRAVPVVPAAAAAHAAPERRTRLSAMGVEIYEVIPFTRELAALEPEDSRRALSDRAVRDEGSRRRRQLRAREAAQRQRSAPARDRRHEGLRGRGRAAARDRRRAGDELAHSIAARRGPRGRGDPAARPPLRAAPGSSSRAIRSGGCSACPTANLRLHEERLVPANGIYAVWARIETETEWRSAAMSIGVRPTFGGQVRTLEVHILGLVGRARGPRPGRRVRALAAPRDQVREPRRALTGGNARRSARARTLLAAEGAPAATALIELTRATPSGAQYSARAGLLTGRTFAQTQIAHMVWRVLQCPVAFQPREAVASQLTLGPDESWHSRVGPLASNCHAGGCRL